MKAFNGSFEKLAMTRKDFRLLARILRDLKPDTYSVWFVFWRQTVCYLADQLTHIYPKFKRDWFIKACGIEEAE